MQVVTGWHPAAWREYAEMCISSFCRHWPASAELIAYVEEPAPAPCGTLRSLWECRGLMEFMDACRRDRRKAGLAPVRGWRPKDHRVGYSYRFDALKFCRQMFIPEAAASLMEDGELMVWLDVDVKTDRDIPDDFIAGLIGDADIVYLGRERMHSDIGFWAIRVGPATRAFVAALAGCYRSGRVFELSEWHSAFVFDHVLQGLAHTMSVTNLTPGGAGHVWFSSPLGEYTDHLKGKRKALGSSPERK